MCRFDVDGLDVCFAWCFEVELRHAGGVTFTVDFEKSRWFGVTAYLGVVLLGLKYFGLEMNSVLG